jgi:hypothetical protein
MLTIDCQNHEEEIRAARSSSKIGESCLEVQDSPVLPLWLSKKEPSLATAARRLKTALERICPYKLIRATEGDESSVGRTPDEND